MRPAPTIALLALLLLAGCFSATNPAATTANDSEPTTPTGSMPVDQTAEEAETGTATRGRPTDANTVTYGELNAQQQAAVDTALRGTATFVPDSPSVNDSEGYSFDDIDPFRNNEYVSIDGQYYAIDLSSGGKLYASYGIRATASEPDGDATVVPLSKLPARIRDEVRAAIENGSYHAPMGKWDSLPEPLGDTEYVRYENETYRMTYVVGDFWAWELRLDRVE